jgi:hypothetical protein
MNATPDEDRRERWLPTGHAVKLAQAVLDRSPRHDYALIPMIQPGKTRGIWMAGQAVKTVEFRVYLAVNRDVQPGETLQSHSEARGKACADARKALRDRPGTVAYAVVERDGHVAVFEDVL